MRYVIVLMVSALFDPTAGAAGAATADNNETALKLRLTTTLSMAAVPAEPRSGLVASTLTGDWGGTRSRLQDEGLTFTASHKSDFLADTYGGIRRGINWMGYTEAGLQLDLEKLLGWSAATAYIHYHSELGTQFNQKYAGTFIGVDNIETAANTAQFNNAWIQKSLADDSFSVLAGLYAIDSEFYVTDTSGVFIQPPYGMANDMAQAGVNGPPIYPLGALALRMKYTAPGKDYYAQYALTDGVPGDPGNPRGTHIQLNRGDGSLSVMELGLTPQSTDSAQVPGQADAGEPAEYFNKTAIGFWHQTARLDDLVAVDAAGNPVQRTDQGVYFLSERTLMTEPDHPAQGLSGFVRIGTANSDLHQADWTGSIGLRYHGLIAGHEDDIAGFAVTYNHAGEKFRLINPGAADNQLQVEATYRTQLYPWFALQPTVQYIANPNMKIDPDGNPTLKNEWVMGARAEVDF